jgi:glycosyltransferase involved in cell wall biosynthesis
MARALVRHHGPIPPPRVVPNGRDPARFRTGPKEPLVLGAGRVWDEAKNAAALARIAPRLSWPVAIAGEGANPSAPLTPACAFGATARSRERGAGFAHVPCRGLRPRTPTPLMPGGEGEKMGAHLLGQISEDELARWLSRAAIFAHPARYEPFGLAVLEAALSGCALVLGDIESLRELWDGAAEFVPPRDEDALADRIEALARDGPRRAALAARGRSRALAFTPARMADGYLALYGAVIGRAQAGGLRP